MKFNEPAVFRWTALALAAVGAIALGGFAVSARTPDDGALFAESLLQAEPELLETIFTEGYLKTEINYQDPLLLSRNIFLTTDLDQRQATEIMEKLKYLESIDPEKEITIYIDTAGGYGGIMLVNYIRTLACPVNAVALDYCASAGCELLAGATGRRRAFPTSRIIVHIVKESGYEGDDERYGSDRLQDRVNGLFWRKYSKLPESLVDRDAETFLNFTAEEALGYGIIDEIIE